MKNKKGFTLVELIAVITILAIISLVSFAVLTRTLKNNKSKEEETFKNNVINAAELYLSANINSYPELDEGEKITFSIQTLINNGYLNSDLSNPTDCDFSSTSVVVNKDENGNLSYDVDICNNSSN